MELKTAPMATVEQGQDVQIVGDTEEYYKIKPPEGSFVYIAQQYVDPVKPIAAADAKAQPPAASKSGAVADSATGGATRQILEQLTNGAARRTPPATQPTNEAEAVAETPAPATQPSDAATVASNSFDQIEGDFKAANEKPINDQPLALLMSGYQDLMKQDALPASMRRISEIRIATIKLRDEARQEFIATRASQDKAAERRKALEAEREEIQDRIKQTEIVVYAAVGTLRTSSIQRGTQTLYRLTDPSTGRTVAYLRTSDSKYATLLGQFVGVKGSINVDPALNMKMIDQPTETVAVDQSKVNKTVTAQIIPPSLLGGVRSASTGE
jgi:predicted pyridoxine 5'-phosphate oxidase superfamily flavin-nucleotide-binding protein